MCCHSVFTYVFWLFVGVILQIAFDVMQAIKYTAERVLVCSIGTVCVCVRVRFSSSYIALCLFYRSILRECAVVGYPVLGRTSRKLESCAVPTREGNRREMSDRTARCPCAQAL